MDLKQWCQLDEQIYIAEIDERYKQHAGASYSERMIAQLAEMRTISAKTFVEFFPHTIAFANAPVNWSTWRQFNSIEKDSKKRKEVVNEFILKTQYISQIVKKRFDQMNRVYSEYSDNKLSPLKDTLRMKRSLIPT
jgi:hypothetical protein